HTRSDRDWSSDVCSSDLDYTFADAPPADLICVPGGFGTRPGMDDQALIDFIRTKGSAAQWVTSVCTGAMLLHKAGFLAGKRAAKIGRASCRERERSSVWD